MSDADAFDYPAFAHALVKAADGLEFKRQAQKRGPEDYRMPPDEWRRVADVYRQEAERIADAFGVPTVLAVEMFTALYHLADAWDDAYMEAQRERGPDSALLHCTE